jgi:hypothetical protein
MADGSSRSLLAPAREYTKNQSAWRGQRSTYKLPTLIFTFLTLLVACIIASIFILLRSHEHPVGSWAIRPSILLSIMAGIYPIALSGLFTAGVAVVWWRSITHGTTLKTLHYINAGASPKDIPGAFLAGGHARRVALGALVVFTAKLTIGPFLQQATKPELRDITRDITMSIRIASEIPDGAFGTISAINTWGIDIQQNTFFGYNLTVEDGAEFHCPGNGTCEGNVTAAGINFACSSKSVPFDFFDPGENFSTVFSIDMKLQPETNPPLLLFDSTYISAVDDNCIGTLTTTNCNIILATMLYPVRIRNGFLRPNFTHVFHNPTTAIVKNYTSAGDAEKENPEADMGPLRAASEAVGIIYRAKANLIQRQTDGINHAVYSLTTEDGSAPFWADMFLNTSLLGDLGRAESIRRCSLVWYSPVEYVMKDLLAFMFRSAYVLAPEDKDNQTFDAVYSGEELRNITDFGWLAASVAVMVCGIIATMLLLWGWWQLDHYTSLSPLETGKAFGAPILTNAGPEQEARAIIREIGHERVANDGDELVWNGTVYATGVAPTTRNARDPFSDDHQLSSLDARMSAQSSLRGKGHRRGMSSVSDSSPSQAQPSFEHSPGITTRRPYDDEAEPDSEQYGQPRSRSRGSDAIPMLPLSLSPVSGGSPQLPPIPQTGTIRMEAFGPTPRPRKGGRGEFNLLAGGKRPLSKIEEKGLPSL